MRMIGVIGVLSVSLVRVCKLSTSIEIGLETLLVMSVVLSLVMELTVAIGGF